MGDHLKSGRWTALVVTALGAGLLAVGLVIGRVSAPARQDGYASGHRDGFTAGQRAGEAEGVQEGRASQVGASLPADSRQPVQDAFNSGYTAGANDVFSGYDGGWRIGVPYLITLEPGDGAITYRIASRAEGGPN